MLKIKSEKKSYGINFPTSLNEITPEILTELTANVKLPKHHCIVALCFNTKVFEFFAAMNSQRSTDVAVTPLLAKMHDKDIATSNAAVGDKLIIDRSSLERGVHLNIPTLISSNNAHHYFKEDPELSRAMMTRNSETLILDSKTNKSLVAGNSPRIIVLEFKIVPVVSISASINPNESVIDPFKINDVA